jgi:hypothetical protein
MTLLTPETARAKAREIAAATWRNLCDRQGFGLESIETDDPEVFEELIGSIAEPVASALLAAQDEALEMAAMWHDSEALMMREAAAHDHPDLAARHIGYAETHEDAAEHFRALKEKHNG